MIGNSPLTKKKKDSAVAKLSLISLMDIFTILVFFLLLNSGETQDIDSAKFVSLPDSNAGQSLHEELKILVGKDFIYYEEEPIAKVEDVLKAPGERIETLSEVLIEHSENLGDKITEIQEETGFSVTLMADKAVPYQLLKTVMETCREANYVNISLAVNQVLSASYNINGVLVPESEAIPASEVPVSSTVTGG